MELYSGDVIYFGPKYCLKNGFNNLGLKKLTEVLFDDGWEIGLIIEGEKESIYHLFDNDLSGFMDCKLYREVEYNAECE